MRTEEITANHRCRLALVYVRQSTLQQVREHRESLRRQRALIRRAEDLGWPGERVVGIDEDLGESASRTQVRSGFTRMVSETALGKVG